MVRRVVRREERGVRKGRGGGQGKEGGGGVQ